MDLIVVYVIESAAYGVVFTSHYSEFKIYDATAAKTSLKIANSSLPIFWSLCKFVLKLLKASGTTQEMNLEVLCQS